MEGRLRRARQLELGELETPAVGARLSAGWRARWSGARPRGLAVGSARGLGVRALAIATGLAAAVPVIASTIRAVQAGWVPAGDDGIIATRGWDVLTSHTPLVGQYSEAGLVIHGQLMHSPGPMLYWLLAVPARFGSLASIAVAMGVLNTLAIIGCVVLARRRGGLPLMFASALGIALMCQSLPSEAMHDVWNPAAGLFPFLLLIFVCWSFASGEYRLLPLAVLLASFVTQTHLMYAAPTAVLLVVACGGLLIDSLRRRRARRASETTSPGWVPEALQPPARAPEAPEPPGCVSEAPQPPARVSEAPQPPGRIWPWAALALVLAAVCWTAPAIDQIENSPGNLTMIVRTAEHRERTLGATVGWNAVVRSVGVRPWWLYVPPTEWDRKTDVRKTPSALARDSTIALLLALALVGLVGLAVRRRDLVTGALIGLGLCGAIALQVASNPATRLLAETLGYTLWWGSELGFWVWLLLAWALWLGLAALARPAWRALRRRGETPPSGVRALASALVAVLCLGGVLVVGEVVAGTAKPDSHRYEYRPIGAVAAGIERTVPPGQTIGYRFAPLDIGTQPMETGIRFLLVRHGDRVLAKGSLPRLGSYYERYNRPVQWLVYLADGTRGPPHMRLAARVRFVDPWKTDVLSAWVGRPPRG